MTYLDLINNFWRMHGSQEFGPNEIALYFYLLNECNRQGWPSPLVRPNSKICLGLGMTEPTLIRCRNKLKMRGVLDFESGKQSRKAPSYCLKNISSNISSGVSSNVSSNESSGVSIYKTIRQEENKTKENSSTTTRGCEENSQNLEIYFDARNSQLLEQVVMELHRVNPSTRTIADFRRMAEAVVAEWELSGATHTGYRDWASHLINHVRILNRMSARDKARGGRKREQEINPFDEYIRQIDEGRSASAAPEAFEIPF